MNLYLTNFFFIISMFYTGMLIYLYLFFQINNLLIGDDVTETCVVTIVHRLIFFVKFFLIASCIIFISASSCLI